MFTRGILGQTLDCFFGTFTVFDALSVKKRIIKKKQKCEKEKDLKTDDFDFLNYKR